MLCQDRISNTHKQLNYFSSSAISRNIAISYDSRVFFRSQFSFLFVTKCIRAVMHTHEASGARSIEALIKFLSLKRRVVKPPY